MAVIHESETPTQELIVTPISVLTFKDQIKLIIDWAKKDQSKMVCVSNVHMLVEAWQNSNFANILKSADLAIPEGMPLVWMLRLLGYQQIERFAGIDIFQSVCKQAELEQISIFLLGSLPEILDKISQRLKVEFPNLKVGGTESPPFRPLSDTADMDVVQKINDSGAKIIFVALGCPKQELWMALYRDKIQAVMIGVGGVFPIYAGVVKATPRFMQKNGLEWLFRLSQEPKRLWKRYATTMPVFVWLMLKQIICSKRNHTNKS